MTAEEVITFLGELLPVISAFLLLLRNVRTVHKQVEEVHGKVSEVHGEVLEAIGRADASLARTDQLNALLTASDIQIPPNPSSKL